MGRAGTRKGPCQGCWGPLDPASAAAICPQVPQALGASVPHGRQCPEPRPPWGVFKSQRQHWPRGRVSGRAGACPGEQASHLPPLAGPALLCPGSGPSRAARAPSGGEPPRFIFRLALRAASWPEPPSGEARGSGRTAGGWPHAGPREHSKAPFASGAQPAREAGCPARTGQGSKQAPQSPSTHHSRVRPLPLQPGLTGAGLRALQGCLSPPCHEGLPACQGEKRKAHPIRERKALQSAVG